MCRGGGGTSFNAAIDWCNNELLDHYPDVSEIFHLTDGKDKLSHDRTERVLPMTWLYTDRDTSLMPAASNDLHIQVQLS